MALPKLWLAASLVLLALSSPSRFPSVAAWIPSSKASLGVKQHLQIGSSGPSPVAFLPDRRSHATWAKISSVKLSAKKPSDDEDEEDEDYDEWEEIEYVDEDDFEEEDEDEEDENIFDFEDDEDEDEDEEEGKNVNPLLQHRSLGLI